jgi:hypothetical protein
MVCKKCNKDKGVDEFSFKDKKTGKRHTRCKVCIKGYRQNYYSTNKEVAIAYALDSTKKMRARNSQYIWDYLTNNPCIDCGEDDPIVLEFDHRDGVNKIDNISRATRNGWGLDRIIEEIDKCDVRCANCHRRRTAKQLDWYKFVKVNI